MSKCVVQRDPRKDAAAQNAQEGVVTVADLSLLTGIPVPQLTKFAKTGLLEHYGEYHGKRFFNFQTIANWAVAPGEDSNEAKIVIRKGMESELRTHDCPYSIERSGSRIKINWKVSVVALS